MSPKWRLLPLPLLIACGSSPHSAERIYRESEALGRRGLTRQAIEVADRGWRQWKDRSTTEWHWKFRLLKAELLISQRSTSRALALLQWDQGKPAPGELNARFMADLAQAKEDPKLLDQVFELASREGYSALLPLIELRRADLDGYTDRSEAYIRNSLALARAQSDKYQEARALVGFGFQRLSVSRFDEAVPWLEQGETLAAQTGDDRLRERALGNLGLCYHRLGDFDRALNALSEAATLARRLEDEDYLHSWLNNIGNVYYRRREFAQAISYYNRAADLARKLNNELSLTVMLNNLAATSLESGDLASAERFNSQASELISKTGNRRSLLNCQLHTAWIAAARKQAQAESSFRSVIDAAAGSQEQFVLWEAQAGLARLLRAGARDAEADAEYRNALSTIETEWSKLGEDRHKVTFLAQLIDFYSGYVDFLASRGETARAAAIADSARARVLAENLGSEPGASRIGIQPPKSGSILLSYWLAPARSYLWVIRPQGVSQFILPGEARIAALVNQYTAVIERGHDPLERANPTGRQLYQELLAPARALIPPGSSVIVVPDGCLHGVNLETLIVEDPAPHYWIEDVTVAVAPALGLLQSPPSRRSKPARLLFLGDPATADPAFPALPHLRREAEIVRRSFPPPALTVFTGADAHPKTYSTANPGEYAFIHFAAHAVANAESPLNSAVILSRIGEEYKLYAKDVIAQRLQADLVTISACRSAGARTYAGEGLLGFSWAFLQAGARNVIAGLWDADDAATADIMSEFYGRLASGSRPAAALRLAKLALLKSQGPNRRPYYWGPLILFTRDSELGLSDRRFPALAVAPKPDLVRARPQTGSGK